MRRAHDSASLGSGRLAAVRLGKAALATAFFGCLIWADLRLARRRLPTPAPPSLPAVSFVEGQPVITVPGKVVVAEVARYNDELFAYLMTGY